VHAVARDVAALKSLSGAVTVHEADLSDAASTARVAEALGKAPLDVLVNNAGIAMSAPIHKTTDAELARVMAINVTAPFVPVAGRSGRRSRRAAGRVINVASTAALKGYKYTAAYCASKHAAARPDARARARVGDEGGDGQRGVPGWVDTDMFTASANAVLEVDGPQPRRRARRAREADSDRAADAARRGRRAWCGFWPRAAAAAITGSHMEWTEERRHERSHSAEGWAGPRGYANASWRRGAWCRSPAVGGPDEFGADVSGLVRRAVRSRTRERGDGAACAGGQPEQLTRMTST